MVREVLVDDVRSGLAQLVGREPARCDTNRHRSDGARTRNIMRRIADDENARRLDVVQAAVSRAFDRKRHEIVAVGGIIAKRAALEVPPQIKMLELDASAFLKVAGQKTEQHIGTAVQDFQQLANARHHRFDAAARSERLEWLQPAGPLDLSAKMRDVAIAQTIARQIRESSGGFRYVKAMGLYLPSRDCAQVSMNLTNFEKTPLHLVYEMIAAVAKELGTEAVCGEIIGFIPRRAYEMAPEFFQKAENFTESRILEIRIAELLR